MLYWAYGSNLNIQGMMMRCPDAVKVGPLEVEGALVFRGVADVEHRPGSIVPGGLWRISSRDEEELDRYEGVRTGLYRREFLTLRLRGKKERCLFYQMNNRGVAPPNEYYLNTIIQGYKDFGLDLSILERAVAESWENKRITKRIARRRKKAKHAGPFAMPDYVRK